MVCLHKICFVLVTTTSLLIAWTADIQAASETVLLDFGSPSCGPCHQMRPTVQKLIREGYPVREIDISRDMMLADRYNITHVPAFVVLVNGQEITRSIGPTSYIKLKRMLQSAGIQPGRQGPSAIANPFSNATARTPSDTQLHTRSPTDNVTLAVVGPKNITANVTHLLESTVLLTIQDPQGNSTGTGTIVDARDGEALVLTCGHLFRASGGKGTITITLFQATTQGTQVRTTLKGQFIDFDLERDLGLVSFHTIENVQVAPIAPIDTQLAPGYPVTTIGCNHGNNPSAISTQITALNRYQGPANVEAAGAPIEGRSGGGMFNQHGQLIGVCFAADPPSDEGLYAATSSIHAKLNDLGLEMVYQSPSSGKSLPQQAPVVLAQHDDASAQTSLAPAGLRKNKITPTGPSHPLARTLPNHLTIPKASPSGNHFASQNSTISIGQGGKTIESFSPSERALLEELDRRGATSEIILIIQPSTAGGKSEVIKFQHATPELIRELVTRGARNEVQGASLR